MIRYESLLWDHIGHVGTVTLNRPQKLNAMSWVMFKELKDVFDRAAADPEVRCVVVAGAGGAFCSGADLTDPANTVSDPFQLQDRMRFINEVARSVIDCPKPTIAKVTGMAAGAGCNLAFGCDFIVATEEARFAELFVKRGLVVDFGGTWALTRLLPLNKAKELAMLGYAISAERANEMGLLNRLCKGDEIEGVVYDLARRLALMPPRTVAMIKANMNRAAERSLQENLAAEADAQSLAFASEDTREAVLAWIEKREPRFIGR